MDIKQEIEHIAQRLKKNDGLLESFKKGPAKAVRELLGEIDLPDDMLEKNSRRGKRQSFAGRHFWLSGSQGAVQQGQIEYSLEGASHEAPFCWSKSRGPLDITTFVMLYSHRNKKCYIVSVHQKEAHMEEKQTIHITTEKELRTYMHPLRQNILFELSLRPQGMTAKQLADALGIAPSSAGHHLGKLEQMGLAELARTEVIHGFCAKFYKAADVTVNIDVHRAAPLMHKALLNNNTAQQLQRMFDVAQHMQPGDEKANPLLAGARYSTVHLTQREAQEFSNMIANFFHSHSTARQAGEDTHIYEISVLSTDLTIWQQRKGK